MKEHAPFLPGLSPVGGKPVHVTFDGGRLTSDAGVLLLAEIERRLGLAERLARCIEDPLAPERVRHGLAELIRFRALLIAAGDADANDCEALRTDPAFTLESAGCPRPGPSCARRPPARACAARRQCSCGLPWKAEGAGWRTCPPPPRSSG